MPRRFLPPLRRARLIGLAAVAAAVIAAPSCAAAFTLRSLIMPGPVIEAHAKIEEQCDSCHESKETQKQSELCFSCHKEIRADRVSKGGLHGNGAAVGKECVACHAEHKGRAANITGLEPKTFAHAQTNFPLSGAHAGKPCASCHVEGKKYREAPGECSGCHARDDAHQGKLGPACEGCHTATAWKSADFDHAKSGFALAGAHAKVECSACHRDREFAGTPSQCVQCHRANDKHAGKNGADCGACHAATAWADVTFDHGARSGFKLTGKHRQVACKSCHAAGVAAAVPRTCVGCHKSDDRHQGKLGTRCSDCHQTTRWSDSGFDHTAATRFALRGAHAQLECGACHVHGVDAPLGRDCASCHSERDPHRGELGARCDGCHADVSWRESIRFDHGLAAFPLLGKHAALECKACHSSLAFHDASSACADCHAHDDPHAGRFSSACATCHNPTDWRAARFDHDKATHFALTGAHRDLACDTCHRAADGGRALAAAARGGCVQCHRRDDPHSGRFGGNCGECHGTTSFVDIKGR
jgi:hypothetical protein